MPSDCISFKKTGYFSSLVNDYLAEKPVVNSLYNRFPNLENFKGQIEDKQASFKIWSRTSLVEILKAQYQHTETSAASLKNIESLNTENTFTVTTGHQLNLFTGPLYFLYKIVTTINLSKALKQHYPTYNFVPVYWMATEDHDFEEINHFNFNGKKIQWNKAASGAVGKLATEGLEAVFNLFSKDLGSSNNAEVLKSLFKNSYLKHDNLADATRFFVNELFKDYGLVIIDADNTKLKKKFLHIMGDEILNRTSYNSVMKTNKSLSKNYGVQVNPREINLFYLADNLRERIVFEDDAYKVLNTTISWDEKELLKQMRETPEHFSPNVILRPLYQEIILPNLCYIGGGGELAYWFQLKKYFKQVEMPFPILMLRNSALILSKNQQEKLKNLKILTKELFLKRDVFINKKVREISNIAIDFSSQKEHLKKQFKALYKIAEQTDKSFFGAVKAQEVKQLKGLDTLEKRLLKAQKRKLSEEISRITAIQNELFPNGSLQERHANFSELYLEYGDDLIPKLIENLDPFKKEFLILNF